MAYKQKHQYGFRDSLEKGDPEKVIYGQYFDDEFKSIEEAIEAIDPDSDGKVEINEIDGLQDALDDKADKDHTHDEYLTDAPNDGKQYVRESEAWAEVTIPEAGISEPTSDGKPYSRKVEGGQTVGAWVEAPTAEDIEYLDGRIDSIEGNISSGGGFIEAPNDGDDYARNGKSPAWVKTYNADYIDALEADYKNADAGKADKDHTHTTDQITGLDDKITEIEGDITDLEGAVGELTGQLALGGSYNASTGLVVTANLSSFTAGQPLPDYSTVSNTFVIVTVAGNNPEELGEGDWLVAGQSGWVAIKYGTAGSVDWDNISNVPDFDLVYAPIDHTHEISDVDGLQDALDAAGSSLWEQNLNDIYYNAGNVGIGETSPDRKLHVKDSGVGVASFESTDTSSKIYFSDSSTTNAYSVALGSESDDMVFYASSGGAEQMRIDADGNVGIGNASPFNKLDIKSSPTSPLASAESQLSLRNSDGRATYVTFDNSSDLTIYNTAAADATGGNTVFQQTSGEAMRITKNGNVGIGTDSPAGGANTVIDVYGSSSSAINFHNATAGTTATDGGVVGQYGNDLVLFNYEAGIIQLGTSNTERMRIDASGNVGIGGIPGTRSAGEYLEQAKTRLEGWKAEVKKRTAERPEASTQEITLEVTDGDFGVMPTEQALVDFLQERDIGGGDSLLQVAGDGYFSGTINAQNGNSKVQCLSVYRGNRAGIYFTDDVVLPAKIEGAPDQSNSISLGDPSHKWKDGHFSGTIYGTVDDVPAHVKAITPTQIANWDSGTGGGGGATTDGRISDTQITHWDQAYGWGNHASAGYQPAGSYAASNHNHSGVYAPASHTHSEYLTSASLNGYATESWVNSQGFAKGSFVPTSGNTTIAGTLTATDFVASSDERLKQNTVTAPTGVVDQLRGVEFEWREDGRQSAGVIAQEVEKVLPHLVHNNGEHKAVNYNGLVAYLIEEIKDLKKQVEELK